MNPRDDFAGYVGAAPNPEPTMTVEQALAEGYTQVAIDGGENAEIITDLTAYELMNNTYWILEKESHPYQIADHTIKSLLMDDVLNQTDVADEDGELSDIIGEIPESEFEALTKLVNERLAYVKFWPATNIRLIA